MQYQVGDKVLVKSIDWYNTNKQPNGFIMMTANNKISSFTPGMAKYCGQVFTIDKIVENSAIYPDHYRFIEDKNTFCWVDAMIERIATEDEIIDNATVSFSSSAPAPVSTPTPAPTPAPAPEAKSEPEAKPEPVKEEEKPVEKVIENPIASFVAKTQTTTPIETVEKPVEKPVEKRVEKKTRNIKKTETKEGEIVLTSEIPSQYRLSVPSDVVRHDFCKVELRCEPDSKITFQDALRIASSIDVLKNYGVNVNCVIEYVENGKLCDLSFTR
jgi:hypothetical protein